MGQVPTLFKVKKKKFQKKKTMVQMKEIYLPFHSFSCVENVSNCDTTVSIEPNSEFCEPLHL